MEKSKSKYIQKNSDEVQWGTKQTPPNIKCIINLCKSRKFFLLMDREINERELVPERDSNTQNLIYANGISNQGEFSIITQGQLASHLGKIKLHPCFFFMANKNQNCKKY